MPANGRYFSVTIPQHHFTPWLPPGIAYIKGQLESSATGYAHWQLMVVFPKSARISAVVRVFGPFHVEFSRSEALADYVWKDDTAVVGTRFELGELAFKRNSKRDWQQIWDAAVLGDVAAIEPAARVQHYRTIKQIAADNLRPVGIERTVNVFWGKTGTGKSHRAWAEAGIDAYPKDPRSKFWDGYQGSAHVVLDEFRGDIDIAHILRWFDKYPVIVEVKGSSVVLRATTIWITSNLDPRDWYPALDAATKEALLRRLTITHFNGCPFNLVQRDGAAV